MRIRHPSRQQREGLVGKAFDESKHPRAPKGTPSGGEWTASKGHVGIIGGSEYYKDARGDLYRAQLDAVIDLNTGYRFARWEAPPHMAEQSLKWAREDALKWAHEAASETAKVHKKK